MIGNSGADWLAIADDGEVTLDIRLLIEPTMVLASSLHPDGRTKSSSSSEPRPGGP
jgi:hypothetical protein